MIRRLMRFLSNYELVVNLGFTRRTSSWQAPVAGQPSPETPASTEPQDNVGTLGGGTGCVIRSAAAGPGPNDQRSNTINPNNPAHRAAANNRSNQMNPNSPAYRASKGRR